MDASKIALFPRCQRQPRAQILMYVQIHCGSAHGASLSSLKNY